MNDDVISQCGEAVRQAFYVAAKRTNDLPEHVDICSNVYADPLLDIIDTSGGGMPIEFWDIFIDELDKIGCKFSG